MRSFWAALRFLSILPVPAAWAGDSAALAPGARFFPAIGLVLGTLAAALAWVLLWAFGQTVAAALAVTSLALLTRGLHLDGLADTADGFFSVSNRRRTLEIMKDSHTGAMGVVAVVCVMLIKFASLASVDREDLWRSVLLLVVAGRCMMVLPLSTLPYARREGGLASAFCGRGGCGNVAGALAVTLAAGWLLRGIAGIGATVAAVLTTILFGLYCKRRIGGMTGDTLGATNELVEAVVPVVICAWGAHP